jgi:hypothetical protein
MRSARPPNSGPNSSLLFMCVIAKAAYAGSAKVTNAKPRDCCELLSRMTCGAPRRGQGQATGGRRIEAPQRGFTAERLCVARLPTLTSAAAVGCLTHALD